MGVCFICDVKLYGERTRVCSSITPHSNIPYPEKIVELLGEEFVIIVTPVDHMCKRCTSLLTHMDKLENDLKLVKTAMLSYIQKKYGILPPDQPVKTLDVVNGHLKTEELETGQKKIPSGLNIRDTSVHTPLKMMAKTPQPDSSTSKMKIYKCGFCTFQSKELGHVRFHMRTHMKKDGEKATNTAVATKPTAPVQPSQKKRLYRCQVCSKSFDSRMSCLDHIQKDHNQHSSSSSTNEGKGSEEASSQSTKVIKPDMLKTVGNQQVDVNMDTDDKQDGKEKNIMDTNMLLNESVPAEIAETNEQDETQNAGEAEPESGTEKQDEHAQDDNSQENNVGEQTEGGGTQEEMDVDQEIPNSVEKEGCGVINDNSENKSGDLDIESMLAAIHNDNSVDDGKDTII